MFFEDGVIVGVWGYDIVDVIWGWVGIEGVVGEGLWLMMWLVDKEEDCEDEGCGDESLMRVKYCEEVWNWYVVRVVLEERVLWDDVG